MGWGGGRGVSGGLVRIRTLAMSIVSFPSTTVNEPALGLAFVHWAKVTASLKSSEKGNVAAEAATAMIAAAQTLAISDVFMFAWKGSGSTRGARK